jgi:hypothetical protein
MDQSVLTYDASISTLVAPAQATHVIGKARPGTHLGGAWVTVMMHWQPRQHARLLLSMNTSCSSQHMHIQPSNSVVNQTAACAHPPARSPPAGVRRACCLTGCHQHQHQPACGPSTTAVCILRCCPQCCPAHGAPATSTTCSCCSGCSGAQAARA